MDSSYNFSWNSLNFIDRKCLIVKNVKEFYDKSKKYGKPSGLLQAFFNMKFAEMLEGNEAIDLGAGCGNDALFLINKGFYVTCIDKEEKSRENIENKIENKDKLKIIIDDFENVELKKVNLIYSCFSLQFCNPKKIDDLMQRITKSVYKNGFFVR